MLIPRVVKEYKLFGIDDCSLALRSTMELSAKKLATASTSEQYDPVPEIFFKALTKAFHPTNNML